MKPMLFYFYIWLFKYTNMENIKCTPVIVIIFVDSFASVVLLRKICESSLLGEQYMNCLISTEEVNVFKP